MLSNVVLTIAVPIFNMQSCLAKNLATYEHSSLVNRLEVICLNNASEDRSKEIICDFVKRCPEIFSLHDRDNRGYGSSINEAIQGARGKYFRIVDADDWVDTDELIKLVDKLEKCETDVVLTDYQIVNMASGETTAVTAASKGIPYGKEFSDCAEATILLPSIHSTTYRTGLLKTSGFYMQDKMFFVDEEYVILPYLNVKSIICFPYDVYRYQIANPLQSTSPKNRAKYQEHRERILKRLIEAYYCALKKKDIREDVLSYCFERIKRGVGDHFTTLYIYNEDRKEGRRLAADWKIWLLKNGKCFFDNVKGKYIVLRTLNYLHVGLKQYLSLKKRFLLGEIK